MSDRVTLLANSASSSTARRRAGARRWLRRLLRDLHLRLCGLLLLAAVLMPADGLGFDLCWWQRLLHVPCPACGLTRSGSNLARGQLERAVAYHPFGPVLFVLLLAAGVLAVLPRAWRNRCRRLLLVGAGPLRWALGLLVGLFLVFGMGRTLGVLLGWMEFPTAGP